MPTSITELLGIRHPSIFAPMGMVAGGRLAAAVANAGMARLVAETRATRSSMAGSHAGAARAAH